MTISIPQYQHIGQRTAPPLASNMTPAVTSAQELLDRLHRGGSWRFLWTPNAGAGGNKKRSAWFPVDKPVNVPVSWAGKNVYFPVNPSSERREHYQASTNATIAAINCLFAEFDGKDFTTPADEEITAHFAQLRSNPANEKLTDAALMNQARGAAQKALYALDMPGYNADALAHVQGLEIAPSVSWFSGGGYQAVWLLEETFALTSDEDRQRAKLLQAAWVGFVGGDPGAKDLRRVLRLPGTYNYKPVYAPNFPLVEFITYDLDRTYSLDALTAAIPSPTTQDAPQATITVQPSKHTTRTANAPRGGMTGFAYAVMQKFNEQHNIVDTLLRYGYAQAEGGRLTRPGNDNSKGVLIDGNQSFHFSSNDPLFSEHRRNPFTIVAEFDFGGDLEAAAATLGPGVGVTPVGDLIDRFRLFILHNRLGNYVTSEKRYNAEKGDKWRVGAVLAIMEKAGRVDNLSVNAYALVRGVNSDGVPTQRENHKSVSPFFARMSFFFDARPAAAPNTWIVSLTEAAKVEINNFPLTTSPITNEGGKLLISTFERFRNDDVFSSGTSIMVRDRLRNEAIADAGDDADPDDVKAIYRAKLDTYLRGLSVLAIPLIDLLIAGGEDGVDTEEITVRFDLTKAAAGALLRNLRATGLVQSQRRYKQSSLHSIAPDAWEWLRENGHRFRTAGGGVVRLDKALLQSQARAAGEAKRNDPDVARKAEKRLNKTIQKRRETVAAIFPGATEEVVETLIDDCNIYQRWTGTPFEVKRNQPAATPPVGAHGRDVIPAHGIVKENRATLRERGLTGSELWVDPDPVIKRAIKYLMRERVGANIGPDEAEQFLVDVGRLGIGPELDRMVPAAAIEHLQAMQMIEVAGRVAA